MQFLVMLQMFQLFEGQGLRQRGPADAQGRLDPVIHRQPVRQVVEQARKRFLIGPRQCDGQAPPQGARQVVCEAGHQPGAPEFLGLVVQGPGQC